MRVGVGAKRSWKGWDYESRPLRAPDSLLSVPFCKEMPKLTAAKSFV